MRFPYIKPRDGGWHSQKVTNALKDIQGTQEAVEIPKLKFPRSKKRKIKEHIKRHRKGRPAKK